MGKDEHRTRISRNIERYLVRNIPELSRIKELGKEGRLVKLRKVGEDIHVNQDGYHVTLRYEGTATDDLYPHVRTRLIEEGVIGGHHVSRVAKTFGCETLHLKFLRNKVNVRLDVYKPK